MTNTGIDSLKSDTNELIQASNGLLKWKWDGGFNVAIAEFSTDIASKVSATLLSCLRDKWNGDTVSEAAPMVRRICNDFGGIRPGQFIFATEPEREPLLFAVWWPWGNGKVISVRVGFVLDGSRMPDANALASFKACFDDVS